LIAAPTSISDVWHRLELSSGSPKNGICDVFSRMTKLVWSRNRREVAPGTSYAAQ